MFFSDEYFFEHGINKVSEYVDKDHVITKSEWYINEHLVDSSTDLDFAHRFPFYTLKFLKSEIFELGQSPDDRNVVTTSGKYRGIRTVTVCEGVIEELTEEDYLILSLLGNSLAYEGMEELYKSKTVINEEGEKYTMYIQDVLEPHFPSTEIMSIQYYFIGYNNELYLALIGLYK